MRLSRVYAKRMGRATYRMEFVQCSRQSAVRILGHRGMALRSRRDKQRLSHNVNGFVVFVAMIEATGSRALLGAISDLWVRREETSGPGH